MKKLTVLNASFLRWLKARLFDSLSIYELVDSIQSRYSFRVVPNPEQLTQAQTPLLSFSYGAINTPDKSIIIERLIVTYVDNRSTAFAVFTKSNTDDSEWVVNDLVAWMAERYGLDRTVISPDYPNSQLEVVLEGSIDGITDKLAGLGKEIADLLRRYGHTTPDFQLSGFSMHVDSSLAELVPVPTSFSIEHRIGASYQENRYFSQAPLHTRDHEKILRRLEELTRG
jgi:hypothetical protein